MAAHAVAVKAQVAAGPSSPILFIPSVPKVQKYWDNSMKLPDFLKAPVQRPQILGCTRKTDEWQPLYRVNLSRTSTFNSIQVNSAMCPQGDSLNQPPSMARPTNDNLTYSNSVLQRCVPHAACGTSQTPAGTNHTKTY